MSPTSSLSSASTASSTSSAAASAPTVDDADFVFNIDVFLLCVVALFFLLALPGTAARFSHLREWREGVWFRKVSRPAPKPLARSFSASSREKLSPVDSTPISATPLAVSLSPSNEDYAEEGMAMSDDSHNVYLSANADLVRHCTTKRLPAVQPQNPPTHMPAWSSMLPFLHQFLAYPLRPGYSVGKSLMLIFYSAVMIYAGFYRSNPFTDPNRAGYVVASQVPFLFILATKNNPLGWLVGMGYEKLNFLHRLVSRFAILAANVHSIGYMYSFNAESTFWAKLAESPSLQWGFVCLLAVDLLFVLSLGIVRELCYPVFFASHVLLSLIFLGSLCAHEPWCAKYVIIAVAFYAFDRVMRVVRSRYTTATIHALPELGMTRIEVSSINAGWRAGQHVRLKVLSRGMGMFGWAESHPLTIASVSKGPGDDNLVLMCKKAGDWTNKLFELAKRADYGEANGLGRDVRVIVDGPYGGPGNSILASYSGAMFVAGGSGITYALANIRELMRRAAQGKTRVKIVELVWSIPDPAALVPLLPLFTALLAESETSYTRLRISVSYTRAPTSPEAFSGVQVLPAGLTLTPGRPKLGKTLEGVVDRTRALYSHGRESVGPLTGVIAGVCGPLALGEELRKAVNAVSADRAKAVGGVELHEEIFAW